jgi:hypothetical protein
MCLGPKEAMFENPEESTEHIKPLYVLRLQEAWTRGRRTYEDQPNS